jgi:PAS domain S-box-containing protein
MKAEQQMDQSLRDLIDIIQFTETVSGKLHGVLDEAEIYRIVREEFAQSKRYTASIVLLTPDGSKLRIAESSLPSGMVDEGEKVAGVQLREYEIDLKKSSIYKQVIREGKTLQVNVVDIVGELFPRPLAFALTKLMGYEKRPSILTPLRRHGEIAGSLGMSSVELAEHFMPSVRNLAQHISDALDLADEYAERKQAEEALRESEERYRDLVERAGVAIATDDREGNLKYFNERLAELFGYSPDEMKTRSRQSLIHPDDFDKVRKYHEERIQGKGPPSRYEFRGVKKDGSTTYIEVDVTELREGEHIIGTRSYLRDVTERNEAEEALKEYSQRLEALVDELRDAQDELIRKEKLAVLGQLAGGVSHELRHPLSVISNAVYYLKMTLTDADDTTEEYLQMIASEVRNADKIISDLLDFSRVKGSGREEISVSELTAEILERQPPPEEVKVTTEIPTDLPRVFADPQQIGQVLVNLVTNGYQAMPKGGDLTISAKAKKKRVHLSVADTGVGVPPENIEKLFEPLFTTKARGIGLGLAVSKTLVEANGGRMEVESEEGKGSTFTVMLPTKQVQV